MKLILEEKCDTNFMSNLTQLKMIQIQPRLQWKIKFLKWKLKNAGATVACATPQKRVVFFCTQHKMVIFLSKTAVTLNACP